MSALEVALQRRLAGASLTEALAGLVDDDPQLAAITQALALRQEQATTDADDEEPFDGDELAAGEQADARYVLMQERLDEIAADVGRLQDTMETVAAALGACPVCLGADAACLLCRGRGVPGSLPPDPAAFDQVALPAVRARAFDRSRRAAARPHPSLTRDEPIERSAE